LKFVFGLSTSISGKDGPPGSSSVNGSITVCSINSSIFSITDSTGRNIEEEEEEDEEEDEDEEA
jgi:hypothetical protein